MTKQNLYNMLKALDDESRDEVMARCIEDRLTKSLVTYEESLKRNSKYLIGRNSLNVLKHINRKAK